MTGDEMTMITSPIEQLRALRSESEMALQQLSLGAYAMARLGLKLATVKENWDKAEMGSWTEHLDREIAGGYVFANHCIRLSAIPELAAGNISTANISAKAWTALSYAPDEVKEQLLSTVRADPEFKFTAADVKRARDEIAKTKAELKALKAAAAQAKKDEDKRIAEGVNKRYRADAEYIEKKTRQETALNSRLDALTKEVDQLERGAAAPLNHKRAIKAVREAILTARIEAAELLDEEDLEVPLKWLGEWAALADEVVELADYIRARVSQAPAARPANGEGAVLEGRLV